MNVSTAMRSWAPLALAASLSFVLPSPASAQVSPLWDHYKVYDTPIFPVPPLGVALTLTDQFGTFQHQALQLERVMTPAQKEDQNGIFPINDPVLHYTWWSLTPEPFTATVFATNQFGDQVLSVGNGVYLLNPALKNQTGTPPLANHYKCYLCDGQPVNKPVLLTDQFDQWSTVVMLPRYFCNPAAKTVVGAPTNPIIDINQHYICYELQPVDPAVFPATVTDQFVANHPSPMGPGRWLCVPTYKQGFTPTVPSTWGKLKQIYH